MQEADRSPDDLERGGVYSARDFVRSKFHSSTLNDPAPEPIPLPHAVISRKRLARFEILELLGRGGMGAVYRARDVDAGRDVALKVTTKQDDPARVERFRREGVITASLDHPGIVGIHSAGHENGVPWIAYELVEGQTLTEAFHAEPLTVRLQLVIEASEALGYAHSRGVVHRDVKPANILVDRRSGRARVADFGLALGQSLNRMTATGAFIGTPLFMSPEQLTGKSGDVELTPASDVWSLGVILYLALTREIPFDGGNILELGTAIRAASPTPPRDHDTSISPELEAVCLRALSRRPADRYPEGSSLAADLELALSGRSEAGAERRQRRALTWVAGALGVVVLLSAAAALRGTTTPKGAPDGTTGSGEAAAADPLGKLKPPGAANLSGLQATLATGTLETVQDALSRAALERLPQETLAALRRRVLARGLELLEANAPLRELDPVFEIAKTLAPRLPDAADPGFADAVFGRALALEEAAPTRLGDRRVLELVEALDRSGLPPRPAPAYELLGVVLTPGFRDNAPGFYETLHALFLHMLGLEIDLLPSHVVTLYRQPVGRNPVGPRERYLRILIDVSLTRDAAQVAITRERAHDLLVVLAAEAPIERFGRLNLARALARAAYLAPPRLPTERVLGLIERALALAPDAPTVRGVAAREYLHLGLQALADGKTEKGVPLLAAAHEHAQTGLQQSKAWGYDEVRSRRERQIAIREVLVSTSVLVGKPETADAVLRSLPPWTARPSEEALRAAYERYGTLRRRVFNEDTPAGE